MESYDKTRFRITQFPSERIPLPRPIFTEDRQLVNDSASLLDERETWTYATVSYGELYLELETIDLASDDAIKDFVVRHHVMGVYQDRPEWRGIEGDTWPYPGFAWRYGFSLVAGYLTERREETGWEGMGVETLEEFRWGAWVLRDMTTAWRVFRGELRHEDAVWEAPCWLDARNQFDAVAGYDEKEYRETGSAPSALEEGMKMALQPFTPRVNWFVAEDRDPPDPHGRRSEGIPLFSIMALELFNHIAEEADYRRCQNETCGRFFVRQRGRSVHGQHRTRGVKYCSAECAKMQASREYRRRKRSPPTSP